jgi:putative oxidoreductase
MTNTGIQKAAARAEPHLYAALRIIAGAMFAFHGVQKIIGWHGGGFTPVVGSEVWVAGIIELVGGTLVALGLLTRPAAFLASGEMAVAYFQVHWKFVLDRGMWLPTLNKGELAVLYCFVFLFIAARGAGAFSLSALLSRARGTGGFAARMHRRHEAGVGVR